VFVFKNIRFGGDFGLRPNAARCLRCVETGK
jgi:hypothetical protein